GIFEIESLEKTYGYARIIELTEKSKNRRNDVPCPHLGVELGKCGGCPWMIATYESQLKEKDKLVEHILSRASVLTDKTKIKFIISSPKEFSYRNRAQFKTDGVAIGYVSANTTQLAPIQDCIVLTDKNRNSLKNIQAQLPNKDWMPKEKWNWNFIEVNDVESKVVLNQRKPFKQGNDDQNQNMKNWLKNLISDLDKDQEVLELFCGSGNFTEILSQGGFKKILATEMSDHAIQEL